mmetsp:Transcript_96797/g.278489  ORF Transcript_96797/g.278489 Transcript_96797/m.278489 type:complete len:379 (+) Transcript_96797:410-1546(+)
MRALVRARRNDKCPLLPPVQRLPEVRLQVDNHAFEGVDVLVLGDFALEHRDALFLVRDVDLVHAREHRHLLRALYPEALDEDGEHPRAALRELPPAHVVRDLLGEEVLLQLVDALRQRRHLLRRLHELLDASVLRSRLRFHCLLQHELRANGLPELPDPQAVLQRFVGPAVLVHDPESEISPVVLESVGLVHQPRHSTSRPPLLRQEELHLVPQGEFDPVALSFMFSPYPLLFLLLERCDEAMEGVEQVLLPAALENLVPEHLSGLVDHEPRCPYVPQVQVPVVILELCLRSRHIVERPRHGVELGHRVFGQHGCALPSLPSVLGRRHRLAQLFLELLDLRLEDDDLLVRLVEALLQHRHNLLGRSVTAFQHVGVDIA